MSVAIEIRAPEAQDETALKRAKAAVTFDRKTMSIKKLKINVKSLAAESRFIRREESKCGWFAMYREQLSLHRRTQLREESRYALLAYQFLRGRPYKSVENSKRGVDVMRVLKKIIKTGYDATASQIANWITAE